MDEIIFSQWDVESWTEEDLLSLTVDELRTLPPEDFFEIKKAMKRLSLKAIAGFNYPELGTLCDVAVDGAQVNGELRDMTEEHVAAAKAILRLK